MSGLYRVFFLSLSSEQKYAWKTQKPRARKVCASRPLATSLPAADSRGSLSNPTKTRCREEISFEWSSPLSCSPSLAPRRRPRVVRNKPPPVGIPRRSRRPRPFIRWLARLSGKGERRRKRTRLLHCFCRIDLCPPEVAPSPFVAVLSQAQFSFYLRDGTRSG